MWGRPESHRKKEPAKKFAPIPFRAIGDERLSRAHFSVLGAIAAHDQLGQSRQGCIARRDRIAFLADLHPSTVSKAVDDLLKFEYISQTQHPKDRRRRAFRVIYNDEDRASFKEKTDKQRVRSKGRPSRQIGRRPTTQMGRATTTQIGPDSTTQSPEIGRVEELPTKATKPFSGTKIYNAYPQKNSAPSQEERLRASASVRDLTNEVDEIRFALRRGELPHGTACSRLERLRNEAHDIGDAQAYRQINSLMGEIVGDEIPF
ncbi:MarR family transcriptional regulator [Parvularcula marina]|uniref:MarR family transcriptional regulator n=1 Tax=Parvularcula marina TaxID=2292771 RepID=UPI003514EB30